MSPEPTFDILLLGIVFELIKIEINNSVPLCIFSHKRAKFGVVCQTWNSSNLVLEMLTVALICIVEKFFEIKAIESCPMYAKPEIKYVCSPFFVW